MKKKYYIIYKNHYGNALPALAAYTLPVLFF